MQSTRQRIMEYLEENRQVTAVELSHVFQMTQANIRHHLSVLEKDGQVEVVGASEPDGRGRPTLVYMPTRRTQPNRLDTLASALLLTLTQTRSQRQLENRLRALAHKLYAEESPPKISITIQLSKATQRLNELDYQAHWEAHAQGPQVILGRCPYAAIIDQHPELCQMDAYLLEELLQTKVSQSERFSRQPGGPAACKFLVNPTN